MSARELSRREFLSASSGGLLSAAFLLRAQGTSAQKFRITRGYSPGTFSLEMDGKPLLREATIRIEFEEATLLGVDPRLTLRESHGRFTWRERHGRFTATLEGHPQDEGFSLRLLFRNTGSSELRLTGLTLLTLPGAASAGFRLWRSQKSIKVLNDAWERCYGESRLQDLSGAELIRSAWDLHLFDTERQITLSMGILGIPKARTWIELKRKPGAKAVNLTLHADTRAGLRGLLIEPKEDFAPTPFAFIPQATSPLEALEHYARAIAKQAAVPPVPSPPTGWVDWYFAKSTTTEEIVLENLDLLSRELRDFGLEYVQLDSGWQIGVETTKAPHNSVAGGPWLPNSKFPRGMKWYADRIRERGFRPGLWVRPFQMIQDAPERKEHPDWFNAKGQMDVSHPGVRERARRLMETVVKEWGYEFVKYDFPSFDLFDAWGLDLFTPKAAIPSPHDQRSTLIESYRKALEAIREGAGSGARLLACNSVMAPTLGLAESFRIGDDVGDWQRTFHYGVLSVAARWYTNALYWANDPDCVLVREPFTVDQARSWASLVALTCGAFFLSEDLAVLPAERLSIIKKCLPIYRSVRGFTPGARPIDFLSKSPPEIWRLEIERPFGSWVVAGVFNWSEAPLKRTITLTELGLQEACHAFEFWSESPRSSQGGSISLELPPWACEVLSLRREANRPQVVGTSRHLTQGGVELLDERWDAGSGVLSGQARVIGAHPYRLFLHHPDGLLLESVEGGEARPSASAGIISLLLSSGQTGDVRWSARFKAC